jgi:hypothetical protein
LGALEGFRRELVLLIIDPKEDLRLFPDGALTPRPNQEVGLGTGRLSEVNQREIPILWPVIIGANSKARSSPVLPNAGKSFTFRRRRGHHPTSVNAWSARSHTIRTPCRTRRTQPGGSSEAIR